MKLLTIDYSNYAKIFYDRVGYFFCEECGVNKNGTIGFGVHHIYFRSEKPDHPELHNGRNLTLLCDRCHKEAHGDKHKWRAYLIPLRALNLLFELDDKKIQKPLIHVDFKPMSVNDAWMGRRKKSEDYKVYEKAIYNLLPRQLEIPTGKLAMDINFGFSSRGADVDNPVKPFVDILQKKYSFNDNNIYKLGITKNIVKKGQEYIDFNVNGF